MSSTISLQMTPAERLASGDVRGYYVYKYGLGKARRAE